MIAVALIHGTLSAEHYQDAAAADPRIDLLREKMEVVEDKSYSRDYLDPQKRSIANAVQVSFADGSHTPIIEVEYPLGHRRRREEGVPLLIEKFRNNLATRFPADRARAILELCSERHRFEATSLPTFMEMLVI
jgi:2-methylcitrate dehydratase